MPQRTLIPIRWRRDEGAGERGTDDSNGIADETMDMDDKGGAISAEL